MAPRLFGIPARDAPIVAVVRRGPRGWSHIAAWQTDAPSLTGGAWLRGTIYPQRSDVSPDGRWLSTFILKAGARWSIGATYLSISRLPWLTSLAAWSTCGTWTRGLHFVERHEHTDIGVPDHGELGPLRRRYGLGVTGPETFAVERRTGWRESSSTPPRDRSDLWDERRAEHIVMERARPRGDGTVLSVRGRYAAFRSFSPAWGRPAYAITHGRSTTSLADVQWADWARDGRLLVATTGGQLEIRERPFDEAASAWHQDVAPLRPDPRPPPDEARRW